MLIDDREDTLLLTHVNRFGIPYSVLRLEFGDCAMECPSTGWLIGYERKKLSDLIACMQDRRLAGFQLRNMRQLYDRVNLVVEGIFRPGDNDCIEILQMNKSWQPYYHRGSGGTAGISYRQLQSYLLSQQELGAVSIWRTFSTQETAHLYVSHYHWWQKDYHLHSSHEGLFSNNPAAQKRGAVLVHQGNPNEITQVAAQIPGVDSIAWDIGKHFHSVQEMATASVADWRAVTYTDRAGNVKQFGKKRAEDIRAWFLGHGKDKKK